MNQWAFVIAAYAVTFVGAGLLTWRILSSMKWAERSLEQLSRDKK